MGLPLIITVGGAGMTNVMVVVALNTPSDAKTEMIRLPGNTISEGV